MPDMYISVDLMYPELVAERPINTQTGDIHTLRMRGRDCGATLYFNGWAQWDAMVKAVDDYRDRTCEHSEDGQHAYTGKTETHDICDHCGMCDGGAL